LATLGYPIFEEIRKSEGKGSFYIKGQGVLANGDLTDEGMLVLANSKAKIAVTDSCHTYLINMRKQLLVDGVLEEKNGVYMFTQDHIFNSPSTAGGVILGRATNGWTKWKDKDGKTLDELKRK
jgi:hypothetical protein